MLTDWEMCIRLLLAALLGSLIGLERERLLWAAGLRTHMHRVQVHVIKLIAPSQTLSLKKVNEVMGNRAGKVRQFIVEKGNRDDTDSITIELKRTSGAQAKQILEQLLTIDGVQEDASSQ